MRFAKEVKIGFLVTVSLVVFFTGFYFLKGSDLFSNERTFYTYYEYVGGLLNAASVELRGLRVGSVSEIEMEGTGRVKVTLKVRKSLPLPTGTIATLVADGFLGNKVVRLDLGAGPGYIEGNTVIAAKEELSIVDNVSDQITPLMKGLRKTVTALDTIISSIHMVTSSENVRALSASLEAINKTAENLAALSATLNTETSQIRGILDNTNTFTGTLAKNSDTIRRVLSNLNQVSGQLAGAHLDQTFKELQASVGQFHSVMSKINNNEGSLGLLVNDKNLYNNMNSSLKSLDNLMIDLNQHPSKYVNVTIFGGKKNKK